MPRGPSHGRCLTGHPTPPERGPTVDAPNHRRPSPALIVAMIALFVSLSGVATGAFRLAPNSVKSSHIAPGAVTTTDIRTNAVTSSDIGPRSVLRRDIGTG